MTGTNLRGGGADVAAGTSAGRRRATLAAALAAATLAAGCTGPMTRIDGDDRDTSGTYDGHYRMQLDERRRGFQNVGTWQMNCGTGGFDVLLNVEGGSARMQVRYSDAERPDEPIQSYVDDRGRFRFEVPIAGEAAASGTSSSTIDNGAIKLIHQGELEADGSSKGIYTVGIAEFGYAGCSYPFTIVPEGAGA